MKLMREVDSGLVLRKVLGIVQLLNILRSLDSMCNMNVHASYILFWFINQDHDGSLDRVFTKQFFM